MLVAKFPRILCIIRSTAPRETGPCVQMIVTCSHTYCRPISLRLGFGASVHYIRPNSWIASCCFYTSVVKGYTADIADIILCVYLSTGWVRVDSADVIPHKLCILALPEINHQRSALQLSKAVFNQPIRLPLPWIYFYHPLSPKTPLGQDDPIHHDSRRT